MNIIGISAHYHDSASCLLQDGKLVCAVEEERFSRKKHDPGLPWRSFRYCLEQAGLSIADIDCVAYYERPDMKLSRHIWMGIHPDSSEVTREKLADQLRKIDQVEREIREVLGYQGRIEYVEHHQAHAASAFFFSGFNEAAILTVDGVGEWATTTYGSGKGREVKRFEEVHFPHSLGLLYTTMTAYLGFRANSGEYKVMGLAPYGKPNRLDQIRALLTPLEDGQYRLNMEYFEFIQAKRMYSDKLIELMGRPPRNPDEETRQFHKDVACSLQAVLEEYLLGMARYLYERVPCESLCMAGGVALNCVANGRILREGPFARLFVQPAASDAGGSLGAAAVAHVRLKGERPARERQTQVYLGPESDASEILQILRDSSVEALDFRDRTEALMEAVVDRLVEGKVIGWHQGRMEFGPRALGSRSILADPRGPDMRDRINALVKKRESFRPFAPSVLWEHAGDHFDLDHPTPFMLETCQVSSDLDLPAITHVNGSARPQTVDPRVSPRYAALLEAFHRRTGCPILLNTSFNMRGEPIVCTPEDAIACFVRSGLDALVVGDFIIDKENTPVMWKRLVGPLKRRPSGVSHQVYTLL